MYPGLSQPAGSNSADMNNTLAGSSKRNQTTNMKSPYSVNTKKKPNTSSKKRSIESDPKDISTNVPNTHQSDSRGKMNLSSGKGNENQLKAQFMNAKNERSLRLPIESNAREESKLD